MANTQITVITGCVIKAGRILMVQRSEEECKDAHMKWELPGGKVDFGETSEEAVIREIKEETGVTVKVKMLLPLVQTIYWDYAWGTQQTLCLCYLCEFVNEKKVKKDHHVEAIKWVKLEDRETLSTLQGVSEFIAVALEYK